MSALFFDRNTADIELVKQRKRRLAANRELFQGLVKHGKQYAELFPNQKTRFAKMEDCIAEIEDRFAAISEVYQGKKKKIALVINEENQGFFDQFFHRNLKGISAIRSSSAVFNIFRLYWTFNRITASQLLRLFKQAGWMDGLAQFMHDKFNLDLNINIEETIKKFEGLNEIMRFLSVALFAFRLLVDVFLLIKHTFNAKENEYSSQRQRFMFELKKRGFTMLNDTGWTIANLVGNYNHLFNISEMTAGYVTVGFLVFDAALIITRWVFDKVQFDAQMQELQAAFDIEVDEHKKAVIRYSIEQLRQDFNAKCFGNAANLAGAMCILSGFLVQHLLSGVLLASTFGFAACMLGVSLYLSSDLIQTFRKSQLTLEHVMTLHDKHHNKLQNDAYALNPEALQAAEAEYKIARNQMILGLIRNILLPSMFLFACALAWQVCIGLAVATIIVAIVQHKIGESYKKVNGDKASALNALPDPILEGDGEGARSDGEIPELAMAPGSIEPKWG